LERYVLATRGSDLALWQSRHVVARIQESHPGVEIEISTLETIGDRSQRDGTPVSSLGSTGVFSGEIEAALLEGKAQIAVHSYKDLATQMPRGLILAAVSERADPRDALVSKDRHPLDALPEGASVGTSSPRRAAQLLARRPDLVIAPIRGNVPTRVQKVRDGTCDAALLAAAGMQRLGLIDQAAEILDYDIMLPAPAQGALAVQTVDDARLKEICGCLHDESSALCIRAERFLLVELGGGCSLPLGAYAQLNDDGALVLDAAFGHPSGKPMLRTRAVSTSGDPAEAASMVAAALRGDGAEDILRNLASAD
jgi:hydroxymethylbilane synthase